MAPVVVRLIGRPSVTVGGTEAPAPKGAKVWALLALLAASGRPRTRAEMAELLFGEAVDPLGALRWNLAALRRLLDRPDACKGDPVSLDLADIDVDIARLDDGDADVLLRAVGGSELLAGLSFPDSPLFESWLAGEREGITRRASAVLREAALGALARGDHERAIRVARELVALAPFDEGHHALLIRTLALDGDAAAARRHHERCVSLFRDELGVEVGPAVAAAARLATSGTALSAEATYDEICARINVAWQSFLAGSVDHGLDMSRTTVTLADGTGDPTLRIASRVFLAGMLGMVVRGWDEAMTATAQAAQLARQAGSAMHEALALGILAGNTLMRGDYTAARGYATAGAAVSDDAGARALNLAFLSAVATDTGDPELARRLADEATVAADRSGDPIRVAYAYAYGAHADLVAGHDTRARAGAERALDACAAILVLKPWPMAMLAELDVRSGALASAVATATQADGLATATGMSYQRALAQRALALVDVAKGDDAGAIDRLTVALSHARRTTTEGYAFHWPVAWVLDSLARISTRVDPAGARRWAEALREHSATTGMATFAARAEELLAGPCAV